MTKVVKNNTQSEMRATLPAAKGTPRATKHLPLQPLSPGQTTGNRVRRAGVSSGK